MELCIRLCHGVSFSDIHAMVLLHIMCVKVTLNSKDFGQFLYGYALLKMNATLFIRIKKTSK